MNVGDKVKLIDGEQVMDVVAKHRDLLTCTWTEGERVRSRIYKEAMLVKVEV